VTAFLEPGPGELAPLFQAMRRHLRLSLAIILGSIALAALLTLLLPKTYSADATLSYDPRTPLTRGGGGLVMTDPQRDAEIDAQLAAVTTLAVAQDVARSVDLAANPRLRQEADDGAASSERKLSRDEALGTALLDHVKARRVGQTAIFTIGFSARNAEQAARIANGFAASYLKLAVRQKAALADASAGQLGDRVTVLRRQATAAEGQLARFRLANNLLETPDSLAVEQEMAALRGQLAEASGQAALAGTRSTAPDGATVSGGSGSGSGGVDTIPVSALIQQRAVVAADLAMLRGHYGEKHPDVIAGRAKLSEVDAQLAGAMRGNRASAAVEARAAGARMQAVAASLAQSEARLAAAVRHDAVLLDLQNSAQAARVAYQDAVKLRADQSAERALLQPDAQQIAFAVPPLRPKSPRLGIDLLIGLVLGLGTALVVGVIRASWVHTLASVDDIGRWLESDYFAPLPALAAGLRSPGTRDPVEAVLLHPQSEFTESFRSLGRAALFAARNSNQPGGRVIGVTSALPREGKTSTSIAMGRVLAAAGMKVVLLETGLETGLYAGAGRRRRRRTGSKIPFGNALVGTPLAGTPLAGAPLAGAPLAGAPLAGDAWFDEGPRVDSSGLVLFRGGIVSAPAGIGMGANGFAHRIAGLRHDFDVVIIDTEAVLARSGSGRNGANGQILECLDALVLIARWRATPVRAIREAMRRITAAGGHVSGVALSMVA